ncbi:hypothetical protein BV25DRAFT_922260 [Artomyces pyxidatus]|uniref:Uncharacterized protein n=1 Tax=Artomyces pyxidatus TaxID=48021 RepID=A0ACB8SWR8_9AGAM|nr:hypothetical protein BV25DRAFT_922260 [Artomyces pyxidatus]
MIIDSKEKPKRDSKSRRDSSSSDSSSDSDSDSSHGGHDHKDYANYGPPPSYRATDAPMPAPYMDSAVQGPYLGQSSSTIRDVGTSSVPPANGIGWSTHRDPIPGLYLGPSSSTIRDVGTSTVPPTNGIVLSTRRDPINGALGSSTPSSPPTLPSSTGKNRSTTNGVGEARRAHPPRPSSRAVATSTSPSPSSAPSCPRARPSWLPLVTAT